MDILRYCKCIRSLCTFYFFWNFCSIVVRNFIPLNKLISCIRSCCYCYLCIFYIYISWCLRCNTDCSHYLISRFCLYVIRLLFLTEVCFQFCISCDLECIFCFCTYFWIRPVYKFIIIRCRNCCHCNTWVFIILTLWRCYCNTSHCRIIHFRCQCILCNRVCLKVCCQCHILCHTKYIWIWFADYCSLCICPVYKMVSFICCCSYRSCIILLILILICCSTSHCRVICPNCHSEWLWCCKRFCQFCICPVTMIAPVICTFFHNQLQLCCTGYIDITCKSFCCVGSHFGTCELQISIHIHFKCNTCLRRIYFCLTVYTIVRWKACISFPCQIINDRRIRMASDSLLKGFFGWTIP